MQEHADAIRLPGYVTPLVMHLGASAAAPLVAVRALPLPSTVTLRVAVGTVAMKTVFVAVTVRVAPAGLTPGGLTVCVVVVRMVDVASAYPEQKALAEDE